MPIYVMLAAAAVAISLPLAWVAVSSGDSGVFARRREKGERSDASRYLLDAPAGERLLIPALSSVLGGLRRITPAGVLDALDRRIELAGLKVRGELLLLTKVALGVAAFLGWWEAFNDLITAGLAGVAAFLIPDSLVGSVAKERQSKILLALPQVIDQLRMSVEAGVGFEAAVGRAAKAGTGPLAEELRHTMQEMQIGASRAEALRHLADRNDVTELRTFVAAVTQSEEFGIPVAHVLRVQADELRTRRKQRAEERAMKIPVKMVFPLVLCVFPALMIVLLGPAGLRIVDALL